MSRADRIALLLSLIAIIVTSLVTDRVFERLPHIEDEMAYVWQAEAVSDGRLTITSPVAPKSFLVPFVVDYQGQRFGKYPPGWPALLGLGVFFGARSFVNPLLAGLAVWLAYRLGKRVSTEAVGLLTAGLTLTSPFFLMNSGSLLSHPFGLVLSEAFALAWLDAWDKPRVNPWLPTMVAALSLGLLVLTRPLTAVAVAFPFAWHGLYLLVKGDKQTRRRLVVFALVTLGMCCLLFFWQFAVTGDPRINPYTLWWSYDKIGFGPGVGRLERGHTLYQAWINTKFSLFVGAHDLFGWGSFSWIFLPFGLLAAIRYRMGRVLLLGSVIVSLVVFYLAYWIGSSLFGPRYFYEGLFSLTVLSALGIAWLAGWPFRPGDSWQKYSGWRRFRPLAVTALVFLLICVNIFEYSPKRLAAMHGLYGISRERLQPFLRPEAQKMTPALVIVHPVNWVEYGTLLELQNPWLTSPFIFIISRSPEIDAGVAAQFPERRVIYYYPAEPNTFYLEPRSSR